MNEIFEFRKHLNTKKVIGIVLLCVILIILTFNIFSNNIKKEKLKKEKETNPYQEYFSKDQKISLELPKRYNLKEIESNSALKLTSEDGLQINIEEGNLVFGKSLNEIANTDKRLYTEKFENAFEVSDLEEFKLENSNLLSSYKYNFKYIKNETEYILQVYWIQDNTQYYIISICIPQNNSNYEGIDSEIISSFSFN